ncbi:innexin inx1 [Daktulosphaira vitifoliae]|uniref:innexin inx1 n=1 Tax=Daktulosphaira vitifoliae TaxID=58002 RepID=UPI0021AA48BE|nr:innexin inx1 [Daktulosphaira vitifoliae]
MLKLLGGLKEFIKRQEVTTDGTIFRVHVTFTTVVLLACSLMVTATQYVGNPIQCIVDGLPTRPVNTYCWIMSTFTMPDAFRRQQGVGAAHPGVGPEEGEPAKYYSYYQWVCFVLFFQAMLCYFPKWVWDAQEGGLMTTLVMGLHYGLGEEKEKEKRKTILIHYLLTHIKKHTWYAAKYWLCEFLCFINIVLQIYWMNKFFGGEFLTYGLRVIGLSGEHQDDRIDPMVFIFPRVTKCTFHKFGPSGTVQKHDSLCILPLNIVNEKTYIFIWFWFLLLLAALVLLVVHRILLLYNKNVRKNALRYRHYRLINDDVAKAVTNKVSIGDWWVLYMLGKNLDPLIYRDVIREIAKKADL